MTQQIPHVEPVRYGYSGAPFETATVHDVMRVGLVTCAPETPMRDVARTMTAYPVHCVIVTDVDADADAWSVVSDLDLAAAAISNGIDGTAGEAASTELVTVAVGDSLERAAQLMVEHQVSHLVAVDPATSRPAGVISTLDLARALGWRELI